MTKEEEKLAALHDAHIEILLENRRLMETLTRAQAEGTAMVEKIRVLECDKGDFDALMLEYNESVEARSTLARDVVRLERELSASEAYCATIEKELATYKGAESTVTSTADQIRIATLEEHKRDLHMRLAAVTAERDLGYAQWKVVSADNEALRNLLHEMEAKVTEIQERLRASEEECRKLREAVVGVVAEPGGGA